MSGKGDEAGAHDRKSRRCSVAAGNQISTTPTVNRGAASRRYLTHPIVRSSGRSRDPTCIFLLRGPGPELAYPRRNYILRQFFCSAARAPAYTRSLCVVRGAHRRACQSLVGGMSSAGKGRRRRNGLGVTERDGDETRTRCRHPMARCRSEMERSKEKAGNSSRRDEDGAIEKESKTKERKRDRDREKREGDTTSTLAGEGWLRVVKKNVG